MGIHEEMPQQPVDDVSLLSLLLQAQAKRRLKDKKQIKRRGRRRPRGRSSIVMKRRPLKPIEKKIKTLKKLIPNPNKESMGLDGLFRETADYILALQMKVKVMQIMVNVLTGSDNDDE